MREDGAEVNARPRPEGGAFAYTRPRFSLIIGGAFAYTRQPTADKLEAGRRACTRALRNELVFELVLRQRHIVFRVWGLGSGRPPLFAQELPFRRARDGSTIPLCRV